MDLHSFPEFLRSYGSHQVMESLTFNMKWCRGIMLLNVRGHEGKYYLICCFLVIILSSSPVSLLGVVCLFEFSRSETG